MGLQSSRVGRPSNLIMFNDRIGLCCGVGFSSLKISVILCDVYARILWRDDFDNAMEPRQLMERIAADIETGAGELSPQRPANLLGIGIGLPSLVKRDKSAMDSSSSIIWENMPFKEFFTKRFEVPVFTDTISNNAVIGEKWFGAAQNDGNVIYLSVGRGIGAGVLINNELYSGAEGYAGDVSHMVIDPSGPACPCGKRGCWEVMGTAYPLKRGEVQELTRLAEAHDPQAIETLGRIGRNIGVGIASLQMKSQAKIRGKHDQIVNIAAVNWPTANRPEGCIDFVLRSFA